jgi:flagellar protein FlaG
VQVEFAQTPAPLTPPVVQPEADHAPETAVQGAQLERAVTELNSSLAIHARHMSIGNHAATGRTMVTVYNTETSEVIREIPPQRVLDAHASLLEMAGLLIDRRG